MLATKVSPRFSACSMALSMASTSGLFLLSSNMMDISSDFDLTVMPLLIERLKGRVRLSKDDVYQGARR
jgi:hypothetical protein